MATSIDTISDNDEPAEVSNSSTRKRALEERRLESQGMVQRKTRRRRGRRQDEELPAVLSQEVLDKVAG